MEPVRQPVYCASMSTEPSTRIIPEASQTGGDYHCHRWLSWPAVLAGTVTAIGIHWLLGTLGAGAGFTVFRPATGADSAATFGWGTAAVWSLFAILALSLGGWVGGRCAGGLRDGWLHGMLVWSLAVLLVLPWLALGTGRDFDRAMKKPAGRNGISHQSVVRAERDLARTVAQRNQAQLGSFVEEAVQSIPTNAAPKASTRAQREVGFAVAKLFAPGNAAGFQTNRDDAIKALMIYTEMSGPDATTTINEWTVSQQNLQSELAKLSAGVSQVRRDWTELKVAETESASTTAAQMAHRVARTARWTFTALLLGLLGAGLGGRCGAGGASQNTLVPRVSGKSI